MWITQLLSQVVNVVPGNSVPAKQKDELYAGVEGMPYVATKDIGFDGIIDYQNGICIPKNYLNKFKISPIGATLVCAEGGSAGRKIAYSLHECCYVNKLVSFQPNGKIVPKFLYYYVLSAEFQLQFRGALHGLIGGVSLSKMKNFNISYPPLAEQQRIVDKLDAAFAEIDRAASSTESCINLANTFFTNKILEVFSEVNEKSALKIIDDVCDSMHQGLNSQAEKIRFVDDGIVLLQTRNIRLGTIDKNKQLNFLPDYCWEKYSKKYAPKIGDVLFTNRGTIGKLAQISENFDSLIHWNIFKLSPSFNLVTSAFMFRTLDYLNKSKYFENMQTGTTVGFVSTKMMKNAPIYLPKIEEQEKICDELNALEILNKKYIRNCEAKLTSLTQLKQSILAQELQSEAA